MIETRRLQNVEIDKVVNKLLLDTISNLQICKIFYNNMHNAIADNLQEMILASPVQNQEVRDMQLYGWSFFNFSQSSSREILKAFDYFHFINGRFLADDNLIYGKR